MTTRAELVDEIWHRLEPAIFISRREFIADLDGWEIAAREKEGVTIGATLIKGPEFHFVSFGTRQTFSPRLVTDCLRPIMERHGFVRTKTPKDDMRQRRFNTLIGFEIEAEDEFYWHFRMDRLKLHGGPPCPS